MDRELTPKERRRQARLQEIVDAAMSLLAERGLEGLTMRRLAKELGHTEPALYRYFPSKDALVAALTREVLERLATLLDKAMRLCEERFTGETLLLVQVALVAESYAAMMRLRPGESALLTQVLGDPRYLVDRDASEVTLVAVNELLGRVESTLASAAKAEVITQGDAMTRGVLLWTAAHGAAQLRKFDRFGVAALEVSRVTNAFVENLFLAWGVTPSLIGEALENAAQIATEVTLESASQEK